MREDVLEKPLAGEELEIRVMDPALALTLIGQPANVLSTNSSIMKRVSIRGGRPRFRGGAVSLSIQSQSSLPASRTKFVLHETAKTLCNYPTGTDGFLAGVLRGMLPRR